MTRQLQTLLGQKLKVLVPLTGTDILGSAQEIGKTRGHLWEQLELPRVAKHGYLINLGNTAPLCISRQIAVIHDAGVFEVPAAYGWRMRQWYKFMQYWLIRNGTRIATISLSSRKDLAKHFGIDEKTISVVPEGTDHLDMIEADEGCLARFNLKPGRFILVVGNPAAHKNLIVLSSLARMLHSVDVELVVAGHLKGGAFSTGALNGLPQPARYIGRVSDQALKALYGNALCYIFPSLYEGYGLPAAEAMRCGCPVVVADIPALRESCSEAALYVDPHSPDEFVTTVTRVLKDETLRADLVMRGLNRTRDQTWLHAAQSLIQIVEEELRARPLAG